MLYGDLVRLPLSFPIIDLYSLPRIGRSSLAVMLTDISSCRERPTVQTVDADTDEVLTLSFLAATEPPVGLFWQDVLARNPVVLKHFTLSALQSSTGRPFLFVQLGLDFCRALDHGWRLVQAASPSVSVIAKLQPEFFRDLPVEKSGRDAATQTLPLHWPVNARAAPASSMLHRRLAKGCSPMAGLYRGLLSY